MYAVPGTVSMSNSRMRGLLASRVIDVFAFGILPHSQNLQPFFQVIDDTLRKIFGCIDLGQGLDDGLGDVATFQLADYAVSHVMLRRDACSSSGVPPRCPAAAAP